MMPDRNWEEKNLPEGHLSGERAKGLWSVCACAELMWEFSAGIILVFQPAGKDFKNT